MIAERKEKMKKETKKPNRTPIRIIKAFVLGMVSGMLLLEYMRNKKRPYLPCGECADNAKKQNDTEYTDGEKENNTETEKEEKAE